jgi:hypothetical protein
LVIARGYAEYYSDRGPGRRISFVSRAFVEVSPSSTSGTTVWRKQACASCRPPSRGTHGRAQHVRTAPSASRCPFITSILHRCELVRRPHDPARHPSTRALASRRHMLVVVALRSSLCWCCCTCSTSCGARARHNWDRRGQAASSATVCRAQSCVGCAHGRVVRRRHTRGGQHRRG